LLFSSKGSALLTPGNPATSIFYQHLDQSQSSSNTNINASSNNNSNSSTNQENDQNFINLQNALLNNPQLSNQLNRTISEVAGAALTPTQSSINSLIMNPNNIFSNNNNNNNHQQQQHQHLQPSPNTKYTMLTSMNTTSDLNSNDNSNNEAIKSTGVNTNLNFYVQQQQDSSNKLKDELQTVPIHPKNGKISGTKKQRNSATNGKRNDTKINETLSLTSSTINQHLTLIDLKSESHDLNLDGISSQNQHGVSNMIQLSKRRDTENSISTNASSSNLDSSNLDSSNFSPHIQETLKLEKKRERNREAARKCRTRKLEKIAQLELQVKNLIESNNLERAKTNTLNDEIVNLRKKLEAHQKIHNCNLNVNSL
jgi:hypothetical protein